MTNRESLLQTLESAIIISYERIHGSFKSSFESANFFRELINIKITINDSKVAAINLITAIIDTTTICTNYLLQGV